MGKTTKYNGSKYNRVNNNIFRCILCFWNHKIVIENVFLPQFPICTFPKSKCWKNQSSLFCVILFVFQRNATLNGLKNSELKNLWRSLNLRVTVRATQKWRSLRFCGVTNLGMLYEEISQNYGRSDIGGTCRLWRSRKLLDNKWDLSHFEQLYHHFIHFRAAFWCIAVKTQTPWYKENKIKKTKGELSPTA